MYCLKKVIAATGGLFAAVLDELDELFDETEELLELEKIEAVFADALIPLASLKSRFPQLVKLFISQLFTTSSARFWFPLQLQPK